MDTTTELQPAPVTPPEAACDATGCTARPLVQWQRRLTEPELAAQLAVEQARRDQLYADRDVELPEPTFGPMPTSADYVHAVFACGPHAIHMDAAALVHQATCTGPDGDALPLCNCDPEPAPPPAQPAEQELPPHWVAALAGGG